MTKNQNEVKQFVDKHKLGCSAEARLLDLLSELGELAKEILKSNKYGSTPFKATHDFTEELGDVYFSLLALANSAGVDADAALQQALAKYEARLKNKGDAGSGE